MTLFIHFVHVDNHLHAKMSENMEAKTNPKPHCANATTQLVEAQRDSAKWRFAFMFSLIFACR